MAAAKTYLVPLDFSKCSEKALTHAVRLARENRGKLLLVHVITEPASMVPVQFREDYFNALEKEALQLGRRSAGRHKLKADNYRFVALRGGDAARLIAGQAKKSRVSMIVMGSHGRTGLGRLILGSVAEKTLRYADCPVLIVKK
jgi:nucleotide-binding universal stress UspA family protein